MRFCYAIPSRPRRVDLARRGTRISGVQRVLARDRHDRGGISACNSRSVTRQNLHARSSATNLQEVMLGIAGPIVDSTGVRFRCTETIKQPLVKMHSFHAHALWLLDTNRC